MIRTLRAFFLSRFLREKLLVTGIAVLVAALWLSSIGNRAVRFVHAVRVTTSSLNEQARWLSDRAAIEASAQAAAGRLDAVRTLDTTRLLAEVSAIAVESGLKNSTSGEPKDVSNGQFSVHTLQFNVTKADWGTLKQFYLALSKRSPYIGIEQCSLQVDRANQLLLSANFQISSVEISKN
ncbi:MAG TPA: hypothetical protein VN775_07930 [Opitutaceae bacterium]|nr:hypothetical protein [Opitutaceae bacterium]